MIRFIDIYIIKKKEKKKNGHPSTQEVYRGQIQKLQESRKSKIEENDWFCKTKQPIQKGSKER